MSAEASIRAAGGCEAFFDLLGVVENHPDRIRGGAELTPHLASVASWVDSLTTLREGAKKGAFDGDRPDWLDAAISTLPLSRRLALTLLYWPATRELATAHAVEIRLREELWLERPTVERVRLLDERDPHGYGAAVLGAAARLILTRPELFDAPTPAAPQAFPAFEKLDIALTQALSEQIRADARDGARRVLAEIAAVATPHAPEAPVVAFQRAVDTPGATSADVLHLIRPMLYVLPRPSRRFVLAISRGRGRPPGRSENGRRVTRGGAS